MKFCDSLAIGVTVSQALHNSVMYDSLRELFGIVKEVPVKAFKWTIILFSVICEFFASSGTKDNTRGRIIFSTCIITVLVFKRM